MRSAWSLTLLAVLAGAVHAAPLTYSAALKLAENSASVLQARAADIRAAQSSAIAAGRLPDPKLAFGVEGFPVSGPNAGRPEHDDFSDVRVGVMQDVPNGAKRRSARERAAADIGAAQTSQIAQAREVRLNTALAWIDLFYVERRLAALDEIDKALAPLSDAAPSQLASGAMRAAQTLKPEQLTAVLGDRRADLVAVVAKARSELARWTGDVDAEVAGDPPEFPIDAAALHAGLDRLPALAVYDAMGRQADADVDAAKADKHSDWGWELAYQHRDPRFGDMVMVQVAAELGSRVASLTFIDVGSEVSFEATARMRGFIEAVRPAATVEEVVGQALAVSPRTDPSLMLYRYQALLVEQPEGYVWKADRRRPTDFAHILGKLAHLSKLGAAISCPALVVKGGRSHVLSAAAAAAFAARFADGRWALISDAGHNIQEDAPVALATAVADHMRRPSSLSPGYPAGG